MLFTVSLSDKLKLKPMKTSEIKNKANISLVENNKTLSINQVFINWDIQLKPTVDGYKAEITIESCYAYGSVGEHEEAMELKINQAVALSGDTLLSDEIKPTLITIDCSNNNAVINF